MRGFTGILCQAVVGSTESLSVCDQFSRVSSVLCRKGWGWKGVSNEYAQWNCLLTRDFESMS